MLGGGLKVPCVWAEEVWKALHIWVARHGSFGTAQHCSMWAGRESLPVSRRRPSPRAADGQHLVIDQSLVTNKCARSLRRFVAACYKICFTEPLQQWQLDDDKRCQWAAFATLHLFDMRNLRRAISLETSGELYFRSPKEPKNMRQAWQQTATALLTYFVNVCQL